MTAIRIIKAAENHTVRVSNNVEHADIPIDGKFHPIHDDLLPVLDDSAVVYEIETENADVAGWTAAAAGAAGLGGSAAPVQPKRRRVRKSRAKPKAS